MKEYKKLHWDDLSEYERDLITNGCGMKGGIVKVPDFIFSCSCDRHDFYYFRGKGPGLLSFRFWLSPFKWIRAKRRARLEADIHFYHYMLEDTNRFEDELKIDYYREISYKYYKAVRWFGWIAFNWGREKTYEDVIKIVRKHEKRNKK